MSGSMLSGRGFAAIVLSLVASNATADDLPQMQFDTGHAAACRVVSGEDTPKAGPGEKLVEAAVGLLKELK